MIGATVGSYRILRQIGEGGMGAVYLGEHAMLGRAAAIKVLLPALSQDREIVGRFFNEARATSAIRHPGIVEIYDFGFLADGAAYIAMEMLDGESLASRLRRAGRLPVAAAIDIGRQVAAALQAAHGRGITHRDLKPDNMFLIRDPEIGERVKLLDFGIAKLVNEDGGNRTRTGVVMGTPVYMSPEQCRGTATLDSRADLYSLGCVLYELVAGRPPFVAESAGDIMAHHLYFQPDPVRRHDASVPEPLEALIMALLAKDPAMRPASAAEVAAILDGWRSIAASATASASSNALRAVPPGVAAAVRPVGAIASAAPTTLSGAAAAVVAPTGAGTDVGARGSSSRIRRRAAIGAAVVATGAIAVALAMRQPTPTATVAAAAPSLVEPAAPPAVPSPAAPAPAAPAPAAPAPTTDKLAEDPPHKKPARVAVPARPVPTPAKNPRDAAVAASPPRDEPKPVAAPAAREEPKAAATSTRPPAAPTAAAPEAKPAPAAAPPAEVNQKAEPKPAQPGTAAKPPASKWGRLMGDKRLDGNDLLLLEQCKTAAAAGDCATARDRAARIADKNVAMYRAQVITDPAIAACLNSK